MSPFGTKAPGVIVDIDPSSAALEVRQQAWFDPGGTPRAPVVHVLASRFATIGSPAWVVAWARPRGRRGWRWALLLWLDKPPDSRERQQWRNAWLVPNQALIRPLNEQGRNRVPRGEQERFAIALADAIASLHGEQQQ